MPRLLTLIIAFVLAMPALAWNSTGHRVTAAIAWDDMTPETRAEVSGILKHHPQYESHLLRDLPGDYDADKWAFMSAAVWPDMIRSRQNPMRDMHRGPWHYVNFPLAFDGDTRGFPDPVATPPADGQPENVMQVIPLAFEAVADINRMEETRAIALCWWLHTVGDLHQPLHATAWVSDEYPEGDRGGNQVLVRHNGRETNLHALWDGWLGSGSNGAVLDRITERAANDNPREALGPLAEPADPVTIATESVGLARWFVYLNGGLPHAVRGSDEVVPETPAGYDVASRAIARRRVAQAGYRMADALNELPASE